MRRVHVTFWVLVLIAVLGAGGLSRALSGPTSATAIVLATAAAALALIAALLALRIVIVLGRRT